MTGAAGTDALGKWWELLDSAALERLADRLADARVVGLGSTTREAAEPLAVQVELVRALVERGFRAVVIPDAIDVVERYDRFVDGAPEPIEGALAEAWGPWRVRPLADLLVWIRDYNAAHVGERVHVVGTTPARATPRDTDTVLAAVDALDSEARDRVATVLGTIRLAHQSGEHALRAQGEVSGTPFVDLAREAQDLIDPIATDAARAAMARIVDFHATSISAGGDPMAGDEDAALRIIRDHVDIGRCAVILDGIAHLVHPERGIGGWLMRLIGEEYRTVPITFGTGHIRQSALASPADGTVDALLHTLPGDGVLRVDELNETGRAVLAAAKTVRLVSGMYRVDEDAKHRHPSDGFLDSTAIIHLRTVTPIEELSSRSSPRPPVSQLLELGSIT